MCLIEWFIIFQSWFDIFIWTDVFFTLGSCWLLGYAFLSYGSVIFSENITLFTGTALSPCSVAFREKLRVHIRRFVCCDYLKTELLIFSWWQELFNDGRQTIIIFLAFLNNIEFRNLVLFSNHLDMLDQLCKFLSLSSHTLWKIN